jgi:two-component system, OmpR family, sensor histidine kinase BaeS
MSRDLRVTGPLLWKLFGIQILIIGFVVAIVWLAIDYLAAGYFVTLMREYNISPSSSHKMFVGAVHRYLLWASLAALVLAGALSFTLTRRVLGPLLRMTEITERIAAGDYSGRVPVRSGDESGQLAEAFNRMAEGLQRLETLRTRMTIDVAHELRTPLSNVQGYLEALMDGVVPPSQETFQLLHEETMRLVRLVEDILRLARAEAARRDIHRADTSLRDLIAKTMESFRPQLDEKGIHVTLELSDVPDTVRADSEKLIQVIRNLLQNACRYTEPGGSLRIEAQPLPDGVRVVFSNTGGEIDHADLPFLFERYYREEKSRSREHGGAGIGLTIVKELIEAHGGKVGAEVVRGETRIWFSLPL